MDVEDLRCIGLPLVVTSSAILLAPNLSNVSRAPGLENRAYNDDAAPLAKAAVASALEAGHASVEALQLASPPNAVKANKLVAAAETAGAQPSAADELLRVGKALAALAAQLRCSPKTSAAAGKLAHAAGAMERAGEAVLPRILCVHGSQQSGQVFRGRLKMLEKKLRNVAKLHFIDAPHVLEDALTSDANSTARCWWQRGAQRGTPHPQWAEQWSASREVLWSALRHAETIGEPFAGVLGFSNGAAAATMLLASLCEPGAPAPLKFAILCAGYLPTALDGCSMLGIPSLHVVGKADEELLPHQSWRLKEFFLQPREYLHEQGHVVPQRTSDSEVFVEWIKSLYPVLPRPI